MKRTPFVYVYTNGHEWKEFVPDMKLKGIRISPQTVVSVSFLRINHSAEEAASCGLMARESERRTVLLSDEDMLTLRFRVPEFNNMLRTCGADFRIPLDGPCWVMVDGHPLPVNFEDGRVVKADTAWGLYKFLY